MVLETKVIKVFVDQYLFPMYCSFPNLISQMLAMEYHMNKIYSQAREYKFEDYFRLSIPSEALAIPSLEDSPEGLDDIVESNVDNMMEG